MSGWPELDPEHDHEGVLSEFLQSAYEAAAALARWDRASLEREPVAP